MNHGFIPAAFTPFKEDFSLNLGMIPTLAKWYKTQGSQAVFINGTTGEFASLSLNERIVLAEAWLNQRDELDIWVHVGHTGQYEAIQLARQAQSGGAKAISALAPYYFTPSSAIALVNFLSPIAGAAGDLPFYYYHIPSMTHVHVDMEEFIALAIKYIPTFSGLKFSSPDLYSLQSAQITANGIKEDGVDILFGVDEMLLGALPFGIDGAIGSTYNFAMPLYHKLLTSYNQNQLLAAKLLQSISAELVNEFHVYGGISTGKAIMNMLGMPCGPPRPPLSPLTSKNQESLFNKISKLDIFPHSLHVPESL